MMRRRRVARAALILTLGPIGCADGGASEGAVARIHDLRPPRTIAARLTVETRYTPCDTTARCTSLTARPSREIQQLAAALGAAIAAGDRAGRPLLNADTLHAAALMDLIWGGADDRRISRDRAISYLDMALPLSDSAPRVLSDLSAAQLARATHDRDPRALFVALNAAEASIARSDDPPPEAAFNAALAMDAIQLPVEAARAWSRYADLDGRSPWADEAERRASDESAETTPARPSPGETHAQIADFAARNPQQARALAMDDWLGAWGTRLLAGDDAGAASHLGDIAALARGMSVRETRDHTVEHAVAAIHSAALAGDDDALHRLARAHALYAEGQAHFSATRYADADRAFAAALADPALPEVLRLWASFSRGAVLVSLGNPGERDRLVDAVIASADSTVYPAVLSRARWARGTVLLRDGSFEQAVEYFRAAQRGFERAGETEYVGAAQYLRGDALSALGDRTGAYDAFTQALATLRPFRNSLWLHANLLILARTLVAEGLSHAALKVMNEDIEVAARLTPSIYHAEALVARAGLLARRDPDAAEADATRAAALLERMPEGVARQWVTEQLRYVRAVTVSRRRPAEAVALLDTVVTWFDTRNAYRHVAALVERARAWMELGNTSSAAADLESALRVVSSEQRAIQREGNREALLEATREVTDRLIVLHADAGRAERALAVSERARVAHAPRAASAESRGTYPVLQRGRISARTQVLVFRLIGDTVYAWHRAGEAVTLRRTHVEGGGDALRDTISRLRANLERRAGEGVVRPALEWLHSVFVKPVADLVAMRTRLTIVPDGVLAAVPWAALTDSSTGKYLVEERALTIESSMEDAVAPDARGGRWVANALLVGDPAFDADAYPELRPLPHAVDEVRRVADVYQRQRMLTGGEATREAMVEALRRATVVHYAGHAVADEGRPERSFLLLASDDAAPAVAGRLTAEEIRSSGLALDGIRLMVLAACETLGAGSSEAIGFRGLAAALRSAGVNGVVGSLWRVHDEGTVELMVELHRAFARHRSAPEALQSAQVGLIQQGRSPSEWAAFQFTGK